jgi:hypothetical protein
MACGAKRPTKTAGDTVEDEDKGWEEYKLLQGKVDGIGTFKFQIRGWAITLMVAFLVSGSAANIPPAAFLSSLFVVALFYLLDSNQQIWGTAYIKRLADLEKRLVKGSVGSRRDRSPGIVLATATAVRSPWRIFLLRWETQLFYGLLIALLFAFIGIGLVRAPPDEKPTKIEIVSPAKRSIQELTQ